MSNDQTGTPHPYYQRVLDLYSAAGRPFFHQVSPREAREMLRTSVAAAPPPVDLPDLASISDERIPGGGERVPVRRYRPLGEIAGRCLFMHAGGWVIGDLELSDALCRRLAAGSGCEIVSVDYRLAPEHPFPAPLDDVHAVLVWAAGLDGLPLLIAGESAGANLAAACAIRARDAGGPRIAGQVLAYPVTDHDFETASYRDIGARNWLLSTADMRWFWDQYCPAGVDRGSPLISPLRAESLGGLPPAFVLAAELDPLRDEGLAYARRLAAEGTPTDVCLDPGMLHGYLGAAAAIPTAAEAVTAICDWLRAQTRR